MKRFTAVLLSLVFLVGMGTAFADTSPKALRVHHAAKKRHKKHKKDADGSQTAPATAK